MNYNMNEEAWKDIEGYEGYYQISNFGNVRSLDRKVKRKDGVVLSLKGKIRKPRRKDKGYLLIRLNKDGEISDYYVHRLVAHHFLDNYSNLPEVNHKDENPSNNHVSNLEWCDTQYNLTYGTRIKRFTKSVSKPIRRIDLNTGKVKDYPSAKSVEKDGFHQGHASAVARGEKQTHGGYAWEYITK